MLYVILYLVAIVGANLVVAWLGPCVSPFTAFLFIGLDFTARDRLHDAWERRGLAWKMVILIAFGSVLSWAINRNAGRIALASFLSFALSGAADAVVYQIVRGDKLRRVNWSNLASATVDSVLFPALAFGWPPSMEIVYGQATAKVAGGLFWSLVVPSDKTVTRKS